MNDPAVVDALQNVFALAVPEVVLLVASCVLFVGGVFRADRHLWGGVALIFLAVAGAALVLRVPRYAPELPAAATYAAPFLFDHLAVLTKAIALVGGAVLVLFAWNEIPDRQAADYHACVLLIVAGLALTGLANDLIALFLALELISIPSYIILYLPRHDTAAQEAATKYFLLSVFSSAFLLFGFSYLYGLTGTTNLPAVLNALGEGRSLPVGVSAMAVVALVMVVAALGFRITAVPFHFYAPDVYQGAPTPVVALLAFVPKVAGFVALIRVFGFVWADRSGLGLAFQGQMPSLFWILAVVTMSLGNVLAILQSNVKRLLAYSSVAHAGYMLIGLAVAHSLEVTANRPGAVEAILFYLVAYGAMTVGAFAVLAYLSTPGRPVETEDDLAGLSASHPGVALLMAVFLFSLIGMPLTAGFAGKLFLFAGAMTADFRWLAVIGAVNAAVGAWYYLRILARMYLDVSVQPLVVPRNGAGLATLWACALVTLVFGFYPDLLLRVTTRATAHDAARAAMTVPVRTAQASPP